MHEEYFRMRTSPRELGASSEERKRGFLLLFLVTVEKECHWLLRNRLQFGSLSHCERLLAVPNRQCWNCNSLAVVMTMFITSYIEFLVGQKPFLLQDDSIAYWYILVLVNVRFVSDNEDFELLYELQRMKKSLCKSSGYFAYWKFALTQYRSDLISTLSYRVKENVKMNIVESLDIYDGEH